MPVSKLDFLDSRDLRVCGLHHALLKSYFEYDGKGHILCNWHILLIKCILYDIIENTRLPKKLLKKN